MKRAQRPPGRNLERGENYSPDLGPLVVTFGGGVDSTAALVGLHERGIRPDAIVFSDTRGEKPATYKFIQEALSPWLASIGFPELLTLCRADFPERTRTGDVSLEAECLRLGTLPSRAYGFGTCADKWKIDPFKWWASTWPPALEAWAAGRHVVREIGYEFGEERRIGNTQDAGFLKWFPLVAWRWDRDACCEAIVRAGLPIPPKSACFFCPSSRVPEVLELRDASPDLFDRATALEQRALSTGRWDVKGLGRRFSWAEIAAATPRERAEIPDQVVEPCTLCADGGDE